MADDTLRPQSLIDRLERMFNHLREQHDIRECDVDPSEYADDGELTVLREAMQTLSEAEIWIRRTSDTVRGSGRTTRALTALPDGGMYIMHSLAMHGWVRASHWHAHDGKRTMTPLSAYNLEPLKGWTGPVAVDHHVWESLPFDALVNLDAVLLDNERRARIEPGARALLRDEIGKMLDVVDHNRGSTK